MQAGVEHPLFLNLVAFELERRGRIDAATTLLRRALDIAPDDVLILTALGRVFSQLGRGPEAAALFDRAIALHPEHAPAYHERGLARSLAGGDALAKADHEHAMALDPNHPGPPGALADHALRAKDYGLARDLAARSLSLDPAEPAAGLAMAQLALIDGDPQAAIDRIQGLLGGPLAPLHRASAEQLLGEALEAVDRPVESMDAVVRGNRILRQVYGPIYERSDVETGLELCRRLEPVFRAADPADWAPAPGMDMEPVKGHVFLVGFVRSGTTLLEQVLASHPDVVALEEQATLRALTPEFFNTDAGLERLTRLDEAEANTLRADYWSRVRSFGVEPEGKVFVDKAPLSTLWLPLVAKLFPKAKVLLAIRDPRDVVISAFRHRFFIHALAWPFTDLVETAEFYAGVMTLVDLYRERLPLDLYQHRHEDLVEDFDAEVGRICDFLGLEWTDSLRDFAETAKRRDVRTPSADQVRRGLYREGMQRWRRYGAAVDPILPILKPWVERFGYPE